VNQRITCYRSIGAPGTELAYVLHESNNKVPKEEKVEKIDVLVKGVPVPIHNMFKGFCSLRGISVSEGIIDSMISVIEKSSGGDNENLRAILGEYQISARKK
jgi:hypothetical protein